MMEPSGFNLYGYVGAFMLLMKINQPIHLGCDMLRRAVLVQRAVRPGRAVWRILIATFLQWPFGGHSKGIDYGVTSTDCGGERHVAL